jgi:hypothetical protein
MTKKTFPKNLEELKKNTSNTKILNYNQFYNQFSNQSFNLSIDFLILIIETFLSVFRD